MYPETLYPKTKQILDQLADFPLLLKFYLAGGTALALQLGHRKSSDLDWFTADFPNIDYLLQQLRSYNPTVVEVSPGSLDLLMNETKVSFSEYTYPLLQDLVKFSHFQMANVTDLACMKITAISSRSSKKDFVDLFTILKTHSLEELLTAFAVKYKGADYNKMHILKSLIYFEDADTDPDPDFMQPMNWEFIKTALQEKVTQITQDILK